MPATDAVAGQGSTLSVTTSTSPLTVVTIPQLRSLKRSGAKTTMDNISNFDSPSAYEEYLPTMISAGTLDFEGVLAPASTAQIELQTLQDNRSLNGWKIELPNSRGNYVFNAYVTELSFDDQYNKAVSISGKLTITGTVTYTPGA